MVSIVLFKNLFTFIYVYAFDGLSLQLTSAEVEVAVAVFAVGQVVIRGMDAGGAVYIAVEDDVLVAGSIEHRLSTGGREVVCGCKVGVEGQELRSVSCAIGYPAPSSVASQQHGLLSYEILLGECGEISTWPRCCRWWPCRWVRSSSSGTGVGCGPSASG